MTPSEHQAELNRLERLLKRKRALAKSSGLTLTQKIEALQEIAGVEAKLRNHKLNVFELTTTSGQCQQMPAADN